MTITIPMWLLYSLCAVGAFLLIVLLFTVGAFAYVGWLFTKVWRSPNW